MQSWEEKIVRIMVASLEGEPRIDREGIAQLVCRLNETSDLEARAFWTHRRIACTLMAIEAIRKGCTETIAVEAWFVPLLAYLRRRPIGRRVMRKGMTPMRRIRNFATHHKIRLPN